MRTCILSVTSAVRSWGRTGDICIYISDGPYVGSDIVAGHIENSLFRGIKNVISVD